MKLLCLSLPFAILLCACERNGDFVPFLQREIVAVGGKPGRPLRGTLQGSWGVKRDDFGEVISVHKSSYQSLTNILAITYGNPKIYTVARYNHGTVYLYPVTNVGIAVLVNATQSGIDVTLMKPVKID